MFPTLPEMKLRGRRARQLILVASVGGLAALTPAASDAQACAAGPFASYVNQFGPNGCTIGGVALTWGQFGGIGGNVSNAVITPLTGTNGFGSYFGFRLTSANGRALLSTSINPVDAQVSNPDYDPSDPTMGPEFLPYVGPTQRGTGIFWRFTHSLTAPNAITRLELQTLGTRASSASHAPIQPSYLPSGEPDIHTGCGWSIFDPTLGQQFTATQRCAFFQSQSNNFLWRERSDNIHAQTVWGSTGEYNARDQTTYYCNENGVTIPQLGADCTSYQDLPGVNFGTFVAVGFNMSAYAMRRFAPPTEQGLIDPSDPNFASYGASASLDEAEFRIYYRVGDTGVPVPGTVVPEPGTWALVASGLAGVLAAAHRRKRAKA